MGGGERVFVIDDGVGAKLTTFVYNVPSFHLLNDEASSYLIKHT